ncbi:MAG: hypothetical protein QXO70_00365 [Candidatus Pacearchaeota archaeon]
METTHKQIPKGLIDEILAFLYQSNSKFFRVYGSGEYETFVPLLIKRDEELRKEAEILGRKGKKRVIKDQAENEVEVPIKYQLKFFAYEVFGELEVDGLFRLYEELRQGICNNGDRLVLIVLDSNNVIRRRDFPGGAIDLGWFLNRKSNNFY